MLMSTILKGTSYHHLAHYKLTLQVPVGWREVATETVVAYCNRSFSFLSFKVGFGKGVGAGGGGGGGGGEEQYPTISGAPLWKAIPPISPLCIVTGMCICCITYCIYIFVHKHVLCERTVAAMSYPWKHQMSVRSLLP